MKRRLIRIVAMLAVIAAFVSCMKENAGSPSGSDTLSGTEFTLHLVQTKTALDGNTLKWVEGDRVNLFHAEAGTENFVSDGPFEFTGDNTFKGFIRESSLVDGKEYDWYVLYPYDESMSSPKAAPIHIPADQYQAKDGDMTHLAGANCPLAGKATSIATNSAIVINMRHLTTVLKIKVTNYEKNPMDLNLVSFRADGATHVNEDVTIINGDSQTIAGSFEVDITGDRFAYNQVDRGLGSGTSRPLLHLDTPKTLGLNESATVYIVSIPFYMPNAGVNTIGMNNNSGGISQGLYGRNVNFGAGQICSMRQGSRLAPPFKDGINFYHGQRLDNGTYEFQDGWWRCDMPVDFQFSDEFSFADLFYSFNTGDAEVTLHAKNNQNDRGGNNGTDAGEQEYNELVTCCQNRYEWVRNRRFTHNFNANYVDSDKNGLFFHCKAGYNVGEWEIWFRNVDPFDGLVKAVNGDWLLETTPTINGGDLWGDKFSAPTAVYGGVAAGTEINICEFLNAEPSSWDQDMFDLFYPNWTALTVKAADGSVLIHNDGTDIVLSDLAKKVCKYSSGITWLPAWYRGYDSTAGAYTEEAAWDNGAAAAAHGISITSDGKLVLSADYDGFGFRFAPSLYFEYDYGYAQHLGTKYLPFIVCNI